MPTPKKPTERDAVAAILRVYANRVAHGELDGFSLKWTIGQPFVDAAEGPPKTKSKKKAKR